MNSVVQRLLLLWVLAWSLPAWGAPAEPAKRPAEENDYELYKILVDAIDQVERNYVTEVPRRDLIESAIRGVLGKLDPYSSYIPPGELDRFRSGLETEFGGIGIQITNDDGRLQVLSPLVGTPAYRAGLLAGDRIVEIDGKSTEGLTLDEAVEKLKGDEGTTVTLVVIHPGKETKETVAIRREKIHIDTVLGDRRNPDGTWNHMLDPQHGIGYVRLTAFGRDTASELKRVLTQLRDQKLRGLVLDLRFNPGGLLNAAVEVGDLFIAEGRIVSTEGRSSPLRTWDARREGTFEGFPIVVLVNRYSASASEIVAACLQDHKRAVIMGERTWGKGSVQNVIELEDGRSALKLTTAGYRRHNEQNIQRFPDAKPTDSWGVTPDRGCELKLADREIVALMESRRRRDIVQPAAKDQNAKDPLVEDRQLQAALKYLNTELARAP